MPLFENNLSPYLTVVEATEPAAPSAGQQRLYIDSSSHHLSRTDSGGVQVDLETNQASASTVAAHGARVKRASGDVSLGNNTLTVVGFNSEDYDTDTMHDNSSNPSRLTIPTITGVTTGMWKVTASGYCNSTTGRVDAMFRKNANTVNSGGTVLAFVPLPSHSSLGGFLITTDVVLSATDYVELFVRTTGGTGSVVFDADVSPIFQIAFMGKVT